MVELKLVKPGFQSITVGFRQNRLGILIGFQSITVGFRQNRLGILIGFQSITVGFRQNRLGILIGFQSITVGFSQRKRGSLPSRALAQRDWTKVRNQGETFQPSAKADGN